MRLRMPFSAAGQFAKTNDPILLSFLPKLGKARAQDTSHERRGVSRSWEPGLDLGFFALKTFFKKVLALNGGNGYYINSSVRAERLGRQRMGG